MPTFQSIGFHPALRSRLVVATGKTFNNSTNNDSVVQFRPLETPHSLLLTHPQEWRLRSSNSSNNETETTTTTTVVAAHEATNLRRKVASSILAQTSCGKRQRQVRDDLMSLASSLSQPQNNNDNDSETRASANFPKGIRLDGFLSVSEMLQWEAKLQKEQSRKPLCCGLPSLDALVAHEPTATTTTVSPSLHPDNNNESVEESTLFDSSILQTTPSMGLSWGTVVQLSGGPGVGKTHVALRWAAAAVAAGLSTPQLPSASATSNSYSGKVHYFMPAHASTTSVAKRLAQIVAHPSHLNHVVLDMFRDRHELLVLLAQCEATWSNSCNSNSSSATLPWLLVVDGISAKAIDARRWHRLVRLYHGIVVLVTPSSTAPPSSVGTIHLHMTGDGSGGSVTPNGNIVNLVKHPQWDKIGSSCMPLQTVGGTVSVDNIVNQRVDNVLLHA